VRKKTIPDPHRVRTTNHQICADAQPALRARPIPRALFPTPWPSLIPPYGARRFGLYRGVFQVPVRAPQGVAEAVETAIFKDLPRFSPGAVQSQSTLCPGAVESKSMPRSDRPAPPLCPRLSVRTNRFAASFRKRFGARQSYPQKRRLIHRTLPRGGCPHDHTYPQKGELIPRTLPRAIADRRSKIGLYREKGHLSPGLYRDSQIGVFFNKVEDIGRVQAVESKWTRPVSWV